MANSLSNPLQDTQQPEDQEPVVKLSGSIGPFVAVMSILMVVVILSCIAGRIYSKRAMEEPLDRVIKRRDCFGWLKGRLWWCGGGGSGNVITLAGKGDAKVDEGVV
ncbi:hypothetical protein R6Q59_025294 [Mikania micrantha]